MKQSIMIFLTFITILISSCASVVPITSHPELAFPSEPDLPKFTREMLDCGKAEKLELCVRIREREETLRYHIITLETLITTHNYQLQ